MKKNRITSKPDANRSCTNLLTLFLTCLVLLVAVQITTGAGSFEVHLNKLGEDLNQALTEAMDFEPNYTPLDVNATYLSSADYKHVGLVELYNVSQKFIEIILPTVLPKNVIQIRNNNVYYSYTERWLDLVLQYSMVLLIVVVVVLLGGLMPLCGLFFCCCRCCGKCGSRSRPYDKKHDLCRRFYLASMLIVFGTALLFGVVCAFVTNQRLENGVRELPVTVKKSVTDLKTFINTTNKQVDILLKNNFNEFDDNIGKSLDRCSEFVFNELENISNATSMETISNIAGEFPKIREEYQLLKNSTNELRFYAQKLNDDVRSIKKELLNILKECQLEQCNKLNNDISKLKTNIDFDKLPDIKEQIRNLDKILQRDDIDAIKQGKEKLLQVQTEIQKAVKQNINKAKNKIEDAGLDLSSLADNMTSFGKSLTRNYLNYIYDPSNKHSDVFTLQKLIDDYNPYRYYAGLTACFVLLFITLFVSLGLICGVCGKRPGGYGDDCCNKGQGSQFLLCGVMFMFFFATIIAVTTIVYFVLGVALQEAVCKSKDPKSSDVFALLDQINFTRDGFDGKISDVIERCNNNKTIYEALGLKRHFDLEKVDTYVEKFDINKTLNDLSKTTVNFKNFILLNKSQINTLRDIAESSFADVDFERFLDELNSTFTTVDLKVIYKELNVAIKTVHEFAETNKNWTELENNLTNVLYRVSLCEDRIVKPMHDVANKVITTASKLEKTLHLGYGSFKEAMTVLIQEVQLAQETLQNRGPELIKQIALKFGRQIVDQVRKYLDRVVDKTKYKVGQCGPLSLVVNATITAGCEKIAVQMNGFWFSLLCSMLVFIPTIIVSVKLAILYQKQIPFSEYYVEGGRGDKRDKKKKKRNRRFDEGGPRTEEAVPERVHPAEAVPKYPAAGPPQYQRAPTEYERPPPYYYPGAGGEHE